MPDLVRRGFLERQFVEALELARASDLLDLVPLGMDGQPPERYLAHFHCKGLVCDAAGQVVEADDFLVGIWFPENYLRHADPVQVLTWLQPSTIWHPNIMAPFICLGSLTAGTPLTSLLYRLFDVLTWRLFAPHSPLNRDAAQWARNHLERFPVDRRPLKWRAVQAPAEAWAEGELSCVR